MEHSWPRGGRGAPGEEPGGFDEGGLEPGGVLAEGDPGDADDGGTAAGCEATTDGDEEVSGAAPRRPISYGPRATVRVVPVATTTGTANMTKRFRRFSRGPRAAEPVTASGSGEAVAGSAAFACGVRDAVATSSAGSVFASSARCSAEGVSAAKPARSAIRSPTAAGQSTPSARAEARSTSSAAVGRSSGSLARQLRRSPASSGSVSVSRPKSGSPWTTR